MDYSKEFSLYELDGIPTYQIDVNKDKMKLSELIEKLLRDVYEEEVETIDLNSFES